MTMAQVAALYDYVAMGENFGTLKVPCIGQSSSRIQRVQVKEQTDQAERKQRINTLRGDHGLLCTVQRTDTL